MKTAWLLGIFLAATAATCEKRLVETSTLLQNSRQVVVVTAPGEGSAKGRLWRFEREREAWKQVGDAHPVMLGRTGLAWGSGLHDAPAAGVYRKKEGDGKSPAGIFSFGNAFGYAPSADFKLPYLQATEWLECVDDSTSAYYNHLVDSRLFTKDWQSSEFMRRQDGQYAWGVEVNHNAPARPGGGSCIFLHVWNSPDSATSGCTAMTGENLLALLRWLDPQQQPRLVQVAEADYQVFSKKHGLPDLPKN